VLVVKQVKFLMRIVVFVLLLVCVLLPFASLQAEEVLNWYQCWLPEIESHHFV